MLAIALPMFLLVAVIMLLVPLLVPSLPAPAPGILLAVSAVCAAAAAAVSRAAIRRRYDRPLQSARNYLVDLRKGDTADPPPLHLRGHEELAAGINSLREKILADARDFHRIERMRSEFLGNTSHELRTPIFALQGFIETLLDGAVDDPEVNRAFLDRAYRQTLRLKTLLDDLIEISRIESGEMRFSFRIFDAAEFSRALVEEMRPVAGQYGVSLRCEAPEHERVELFADRDRFRQILVNLVDNGIKYNREGGEVCIALSRENATVRIDIRDTGIGIPEEHLDRIFERFYRVDKDRSREVGGTGLGLAIVKHLVLAQYGTIEVSSEPGRGTLFTLLFPRKS